MTAALVLIEGHQVRTHRCDDGFPGVVVADVLAPFGKRVDSCKSLWEGWARTRKDQITSRMGAGRDEAGRLSGNAADVILMHAEDVPLLLARLDQRGMSVDVKVTHTRFLVSCRDILAAAFFERTASITAEQITAIATQSALAVVLPMMERLLDREKAAREEDRLIIGNRRAREVLDTIQRVACIHSARGSKAWRRTHRRVSNDLRDRLKLPNAGTWASLPERHYPDIVAELKTIERREEDVPSAQEGMAAVLDFRPKAGA